MEIKVFSRLTDKLTEKLKIFEWENFYTPNQRTAEHLAREQEKFFSRPKAWILVFEGDQIIGRILLHKRIIKFSQREIVLGGIGGVCTNRDKRNRGIAPMMLREAVIFKKLGL